ncbi:uncharacterized protein LOC118534539 [Halichoerus grypus]
MEYSSSAAHHQISSNPHCTARTQKKDKFQNLKSCKIELSSCGLNFRASIKSRVLTEDCLPLSREASDALLSFIEGPGHQCAASVENHCFGRLSQKPRSFALGEESCHVM